MNTHIRLHLAGALALLGVGAATVLTPAPAEACGGTFCDAGPQVMPVDQTGESIIFWIDDSGPELYTEAHIQIQYEGDAENFAWIIPVMEVPEVLVGSQALFDNVLQATVPTFTITTTSIGDCGGGGFFCAKDDSRVVPLAGGTFGGQGLTTGAEDGGDTNMGPEILDRGLAGAFQYVTLTGDSVEEIVDWLDLAGYAQDPDAPPILQEYLDEGFVFVAVKLQAGAEVDEIHPLAIRYPGVEPCIPIRLTRIAAVDDMAIRAFFLGEDRAAPQNWPHVEVNLTSYDWVNGPGTNYAQVVGMAIDEAGGRAWVTEYAGTDELVSTTGVYLDRWDPTAYEGIEPTAVGEVLASQSLLDCVIDTCAFGHPQVEPLLATYLPPPDGVDAHAYWSCLECYPDLIDLDAWAAQPGFAAEFADRIATPGLHAIEMLDDASYLTRLFTLISPHEMTEDPLFHVVDGLPTVDNSIVATRVNDSCGGPSYIELPDGQRVAFDDGGAMPRFEDNPAALRIERVPMTGPPQVETDNESVIEDIIRSWNDGRLVGPSPGCAVGPAERRGIAWTMALFGMLFLARGRRRRPT